MSSKTTPQEAEMGVSPLLRVGIRFSQAHLNIRVCVCVCDGGRPNRSLNEEPQATVSPRVSSQWR